MDLVQLFLRHELLTEELPLHLLASAARLPPASPRADRPASYGLQRPSKVAQNGVGLLLGAPVEHGDEEAGRTGQEDEEQDDHLTSSTHHVGSKFDAMS